MNIWGESMSLRIHSGRVLCILFALSVISLLSMATAGSNVVTSPTGKLIITPWKSTQTRTTCGNLPDNLVPTSSSTQRMVGTGSSSPDYDVQPDYNTASKCIGLDNQLPNGLTIGQWGTGLLPLHYDNMVCGDNCLFNFTPSSKENTEPVSEAQIYKQWELRNSNPEITWFNPGLNKKTGSIGLVPPPVPTISACGNCGVIPGFYSNG